MVKSMTQSLLMLTHSNRRTLLKDCSLNYLTQRYASPDRLKNLPPFETLSKSPDDTQCGSITFYKICSINDSFNIKCIGLIKTSLKVQHVAQLNDKQIIVCYESYLELWDFMVPLSQIRGKKDLVYKVVNTFEHPHFAGLHTVNVFDNDKVVLSASAPDAVMIINIKTKQIVWEKRMPEEIYGKNYQLTDVTDLRRHFIVNDYQTTHINSAYPSRDKKKIVISTLIQGAIGVFDLENDSYTEIVRGFVGCHGARFNQEGHIYFVDSVTGTLVILDKNNKIDTYKRFAVRTIWLHDAIQIFNSIYAFSVSDANELHIYDINKGVLLFKKTFVTSWTHYTDRLFTRFPFYCGNSTQFLSFPTEEMWQC